MKIVISLFCIVIITFTVKSQSINCNSFCVTGIYNDSVQTQVSIQMVDSGFVNYPHVLAILDQNGDTISSGSLFYFGQIGETTQDYPTSWSNTDWSSFTGTIVFVYDNDTCSLDFPCNSLNTASNLMTGSYIIFPNPASDFLLIKGGNYPINIMLYSIQGQQLKRMYIESESQMIQLNDLVSGTYYILTDTDVSQPYIFIKK